MANSCSSDSDSEEEIGRLDIQSQLSASTLAALQEHLREVEERKLDGQNEGDPFAAENFGMSQFWYAEETQMILAKEAIQQSARGKIAIISAPSVYRGLKKLQAVTDDVKLLEFDKRFGSLYPDNYVFYDFNSPSSVSEELHNQFDFILVDPPYLNEDCISAFYETIRLLAQDSVDSKNSSAAHEERSTNSRPQTKVLFITQDKNEEFLKSNFGLKVCEYELKFEGKFATPMKCFTNYESKNLATLKH